MVSDRLIEITWVDDGVEVVDVTPAIVGHRHFVALREDRRAFENFAVGENGDCLVWASGEELSAVWLEELAPASLDNEEFREAMTELGFSLDGMAARLGIARRLVADYRRDKPIPPAIAMATRFLVERHRRMEQFEDAI